MDHFSAESKDYQNDLEVEDILNEMGFFANDDGEFSDGLLGGAQSESYPTTTSDLGFPPISYASVLPYHYYGQAQAETLPSSSSAIISPSSSVEDMQLFSVPNPITAMSSSTMPALIAPNGALAENKTSKITKKTSKKDISKGSSRKRKAPAADVQTVMQEVSPRRPSLVLDSLSVDDEDLTEEQLEERRQRNREHAKRSRQRKKSLTCTLQQSVDELRDENTKLREQICAMIGHDKVESILQARREKARNQFMGGLMQPSSRIVDNNTLIFLKGLRKGIPAAGSDSNKKQRKN